MSVRLFVGNLAYDVTEKELLELFSEVGSPSRARLATDRETGKPRGFAFVEFSEAGQAEEAIRRFHQHVFKGRPLAVNEARPREEGGPLRTSPAPRYSAFSAEPFPSEAPPRPGQPRRTFGPDALPRNKRKNENRAAKKERGPKGPVRDLGRGEGNRSAEPDDLEEDDLGPDDFALWAQDDAKNREED
jgi:cold-inducible RNA-binding protein